MSKRKPELISEDSARVQWNQMARGVRRMILAKLSKKINKKDLSSEGYYYGNLYPKTRQAIRRYLSDR